MSVTVSTAVYVPHASVTAAARPTALAACAPPGSRRTDHANSAIGRSGALALPVALSATRALQLPGAATTNGPGSRM